MADRLAAIRPKITCPWCGGGVAPNAPRMRLHQSDSVRFSGITLATFHPDCGDALLDMLEDRARAMEAA